jgi:hypothetical protein
MSTKVYDEQIAEMPTGLDRAMLRVLSFHMGRSHAIGRGELVKALWFEGFKVNERQARQAIHDLRRAGHLICSMPGEDGGYYLAESLAEFEEFIDRELHPKAIDMLETEKAMKAAAHARFGEGVQLGLI